MFRLQIPERRRSMRKDHVQKKTGFCPSIDTSLYVCNGSRQTDLFTTQTNKQREQPTYMASSAFSPPLAHHPPLNLDLYVTPGGKYKPRFHTLNCTCGCNIQEEEEERGNNNNNNNKKYIKVNNREDTYMEARTFYFFSDGKSLEELKTNLSSDSNSKRNGSLELENWKKNLSITHKQVWEDECIEKKKPYIAND